MVLPQRTGQCQPQRPAKCVYATTKYLEMLFENLLLDAYHNLKNRYLHIEADKTEVAQSAKMTLWIALWRNWQS